MQRVSVVIPVYNGAEFIDDAILSVLRQEYAPHEVIVVDDASTDDTRLALEKYGQHVRVLHLTANRGPAAARNAGISSATGDIVGLLDADDMWPMGRLLRMVPMVSTSRSLVRGRVQIVSRDGRSANGESPRFLEPLVGACLYGVDLFSHVGLFDESMRQGEDIDWNMRYRETGEQESKLADVTLLYRRHATNLTNSREVLERGQLHASRNRLLRRRRS